ncbi:HtaA domain-containing protein [Pseudolysinimonas sp.]|jgi:hypothetical protein|uniref:HtaA domain-containing protein n=1 Tax=Pseudolysinimonas sp. TaxID=2680009 RepID=UPI003784224C
MNSVASRPLLRPLAILLSLLLALVGLSLPATSASAAAGDVAGATLQWGVKASFRSYLVGSIAHGSWTVSGVSDATPFGWSGGSGAAPGGTGTVAYPGSVRFQGHPDFGVPAGEYALDLTFSDLKVRITGATTAELLLDARSRGFNDPTTFVELGDTVFATLDLAGGSNGSTADVVAYSNVPAVLTEAGATAFGGFYSAGTVLDPVSFSWPVEAAPEPEPVVPTIAVSQTTGLESGDVVTVTGTGFGPNEEGGPLGTRPPLSGKFGGVYVTFGTFLDAWKPSEGALSASRKADGTQTKWILNPADVATVGGSAAGAVAIQPDGSFSVQIEVNEEFTGALADGNYGIYTYPGSGAVYAPFETYTPIEFAEPVPTITVSQTTGLESGDVVTVTGENFGPNEEGGPLGTRPPLSGKFGGVYVTFGTFLDAWKPSEGALSASRKADGTQTKWILNPADAATVGGSAAGAVAIEADGSFEIEITVNEEFTGALADGNYGIYTYPGSGAVYAPFETYTPIEFASTTPTTPPVDPIATPVPGSLSWGVKASFREYVTGPIASGSISVGNGAGVSGGAYWFPQSSAEVSSDVAYRGSVTFSGHGGLLNLRIADPVVRITSTSSAVLSVATGSGRVDFASLALGTPTTDASGARTYAASPATLTAAGAASFAGFYSAGTALDPVTFTIGSVNATNGRGLTTAAVVAETRTAAPTPPATEGIESTEEEFTAGGNYTFTAGGFQPNESGILVVIYSEPTVLATDATADADGVVTWTGNLPAGLTGEHTFTFQGSVDRGIVIDIAAAEVVGCEVEGAELTWGFKESFRAYIDGSIANGEWTTADGADYETPVFTWATGSGGYDAETGDADLAFTGSVRFTGHGGVLDTTIANPRVVIDGDRAVLLLDVTGTTQDGTPVSSAGIEFAELDLADAEQVGGGDLVAFTGIPAVLTDAGAAAFGTYPAGEALDPIDLSITVDPACIQTLAVTDDTETTGDAVNASATSPLPWIVGALVALLLLAALIVVLVRRAGRSA